MEGNKYCYYCYLYSDVVNNIHNYVLRYYRYYNSKKHIQDVPDLDVKEQSHNV